MSQSAVTPRKPASLAVSATWLMIAKTIGLVFTMALPLLLVRRLSMAEYGNYKQFFLLLTSANNILPLGMNMTAFYFLPRAANTREKGQAVLCILMFYGLVLGAACAILVSSPSLVATLFQSEELGKSGRLIGVTVIFYVTSMLFDVIAVANGESEIGAAVIVGSNLLRTAVLLLAAIFWANIHAIIWATAGFSAFQVAVMAVYLESRFPGFWKAFDWVQVRSQLSYAIPLGTAAMFFVLQTDLHSSFVSHRFGPAIFAIYANGCFQLPLVGILYDSVGSVLIPRMSTLQQHDNRGEIVELAGKVARTLSAAFFPMYAFLSVMATEFITLMFRRQYLGSVPIFRVNLLLLPLFILMVDPILRAYKEQRFWFLRLNVLLVIVLSVSLQFGLPYFGLTGAILCVVAVQYFGRFAMLFRVAKILDLDWRDLSRLRDVGKIAGASAGAALGAWIVRLLMLGGQPIVMLLATGAVFVAIYLGLLFALKVPTAEEVEMVRRRIPGYRATVAST
jgi:O-antigen/teichoic acid export membrane protein